MKTETLIKTFSNRIYRFACGFIQILALLFTGLLFVSGFFFTCYADDMVSQKVLTAVDNPLFQILGMGLGIAILLLLVRPVNKNPKRSKQILQVCVFGWIMLLGGILILFGRTAPAADAWSVYSAAEDMALGNTSVIHPTDSYLSYYPQQVGLMAFFELIIRLWKLLPTDLHAYHFIKCLYVVLTCVIVYYQSLCVHLLWEDERIDCIYLVLAGADLPLIMYSSFVYGEIPSFAALSIGLYYLIKLLKSPNKQKSSATVSLIAFTLSVMLRKNSLVIMIAVVLVTLLEGVRGVRAAKQQDTLRTPAYQESRRYGLFLFSLLCVICSLSILPITERFYEYRAGNTLKSGVPSMAYFAMGMQESSRGNGWYNGFNFDTYQETGMDTAATVQLSREYIAERTAYFREHIDDAADFYWGKYLSQWADGTYASRQATLATFGGRLPAVESVYSGEHSRLYIGYCNIYQNIIYFGCLLCVILTLRKQKKSPDSPCHLYEWLGIIGTFGGFLFHMIWEANARYIFLYSLLLLPYTACGIYAASGIGINSTSFLERFRKNNTTR
ncbi:MAG: hypothetical protein K2O32_09015 [Acetatifactor sp.]|nr:hypothetical protein [Acetatifactor sp.]